MSDHTPVPSFPENLDAYAPWVAKHGLVAPYGECQCGCGRSAPVSQNNYPNSGYMKGQPCRYLPNHHLRVRDTRTVEERFWAQVDKNGPIHPVLGTPCWVWTGYQDEHGYGLFRAPGVRQRAHCYAHDTIKGPIAEGLQRDHLCRNRQCVNPDHLEPVTCQVNLLRGEGPTGQKARQTHCENGHPFDSANTRIRPNGTRVCRVCDRERSQRYRDSKRGAS